MLDQSALKIISATEVPGDAQTRVFNRALTDYVGESSTGMTAEVFQAFLFAQQVDIRDCRLVIHRDELIGFAYVQSTGPELRIIAMGVVPEWRRNGVATALLAHLLREAASRRCRSVTLEVIEANESAVEFYSRNGFQQVNRLCGWRRPARTAGPELPEVSGSPREIPLASLAEMASPAGPDELPWPIRPAALIRQPPTTRAFQLDRSVLVFTDPARPLIRICGLFPLDGEPDWPALRNLLAALVTPLRAREWLAPAYFPEAYGEAVFRSAGFQGAGQSQLLLRCPVGKGID